MNKPDRYTKRTINGKDVIDMVKELNLNFNEGNILKYLLRDKGQDKEDLMKIIDYAQRELNYLTEQENKVSNHKLFRNEKN
jgi:predicted ATP-dependent Lon-type protease